MVLLFKSWNEHEWSSLKTMKWSWVSRSLLHDHFPRTICWYSSRRSPRGLSSRALTILESMKPPWRPLLILLGTVIFNWRDFIRIVHLHVFSYALMVLPFKSWNEQVWSSVKMMKWSWVLPSLLQDHLPRTISLRNSCSARALESLALTMFESMKPPYTLLGAVIFS